MALTPEGTPYVESSDLVANYPAASLSLANRVDLVGVLPFATSAARATAIPSPTDGQYTYLQDTNTTQFWNGTAWQTTGGLNLVTPTSVANPGGTSSLNGGALTFTTVNSISLNGVFTSAFDNYRMVWRIDPSANVNTSLRLRASGSDITSADYDWARVSSTYGGVANQTGADNATSFGITSTGASTLVSLGSSDFIGPNLAEPTGFSSTTSFEGSAGLYVGTFFANTVADGFTITPGSGNISGSIRVYGYQNS